jgi:hypothetical protein
MLRTISLPDKLSFPRAVYPDVIVGMLGTQPSKKLMAIGLDETIHWTLARDKSCVIGDVRDGKVWLYESRAVVAVAGDGFQICREPVRLEKHEQIGCLAAIDDGVLLSIYCNEEHAKYGRAPRLLRLNANCQEMWSTRLPVKTIAYRGCVHMGVATNWQTEESPPWKPSTWLPCGDDQLLVSGDRVLASFQEMPRSGIGCRYVLDVDTGDLVWMSESSPIANACSIGDGKFLMGDQGYGAFKTTLYEDEVSDLRSWPSHGHDVVIGGDLLSVQMSNDLSVPQHVVCLGDGGAVHRRSDRLPGYYTSKPVTMSDGNLYFWRAGQLWTWNQEDGLNSGAELGPDEGAYASSLQFTDSRVAFNVCPGYAKEDAHRRVFAILEC